MKKTLQNQLLKSLFFLLALIIICAFFVHLLTDSETLSEYAADNPELAYGDSSQHIDEAEKETADGESDMVQDNHKDTSTDAPENSQNEDFGDIPANRIVYQDGFYYEPLTDEVKERITGISYPSSGTDTLAISYDDLRYLSVLYYDFDGAVQAGELICNRGIADDLTEIFYELYKNEYQIEKIRLIDEYQGDDSASMIDNNTSCFNYRVVDGTSSLSKHALGCAVDINPFYNPYIVFNRDGAGEDYIAPAGSEIYTDRSKDFPYKIDENDLCYKLFKEHGFIWGGNWNSCKDYQHFQKALP